MIILEKKNYTVYADGDEIIVFHAGVASTYPIWAFKNRSRYSDFYKDLLKNNGYANIGELIGTAVSKFNQISMRGYLPAESKQKEAKRIKINE